MGYFTAKVSSITGLDISNEDNVDYLSDWIKDSVREIYSIVPKVEKFKYASISDSASAATGISIQEPILSVTWRANASSGDDDSHICREISYNQVFQANKLTSILKASDTDPVYYTAPQSAGVSPKIKALPSTGYIRVIYMDTTDANFASDGLSSVTVAPNEIDHLIVLLAAIKATNFLLQSEQDDDIYVPLLSSLRADYQQALQMYLSQFRIQAPIGGQAPSKQQGARATAEELQSLMQKYN